MGLPAILLFSDISLSADGGASIATVRSKGFADRSGLQSQLLHLLVVRL